MPGCATITWIWWKCHRKKTIFKLKMATWIQFRTFLVIEIANLFPNMIIHVCSLHNSLLSSWSTMPSCVPGHYSFQTWVSLNRYIFLANNWEGRPIMAFDPVCVQCIKLYHRSTAFLNFVVEARHTIWAKRRGKLMNIAFRGYKYCWWPVAF